MNFKSGLISIVGKANVGKSTLMNAILGQKIAAVSPKPNFTRRKLLGIKNLPDAQLIFIDTPGIHRARGPLNRLLVKEALDTKDDVDIILFLAEAPTAPNDADLYALESIRETRAATILVLTKLDLAGEFPTASAGQRWRIAERRWELLGTSREEAPPWAPPGA